jgi:cytochrome c peroxidase
VVPGHEPSVGRHRKGSYSIGLVVSVWVMLTASMPHGSAQDALSALPLTAPDPEDNPTTPPKVHLGRLLFWDPVLSGNLEIACATCHQADFAYADPLDLPIGVTGVGSGKQRKFSGTAAVPFVRRNTPSLVNVGFVGLDEFGRVDPRTAQMFWDTRAQGLEQQALFPMRTFEEMRGPTRGEDEAVDAAVARVAAIPEYRRLFEDAFGAGTPTAENLTRALASFERSLIAVNTPFDRYMRGDSTAMTPAQIRGMNAFVDAGCVNCHRGAMFSDSKIHTLGLPDNPKLRDPDSGVHGSYGFRTPSLRNLKWTAPYMHNGMLPTLDAVLSYYETMQRGRPRRSLNTAVPRSQLAAQLAELDIGDWKNDIITFLGALNDDQFDRQKPARVPSGLEVGGK